MSDGITFKQATGTLANRLSSLMHEKRVTTAQLSENTGVAVGTINRLANDKHSNPTLSSLRPICDFFDLTVSQLIGEDDMPDSPKDFSNPRSWPELPILEWHNITITVSSSIAEQADTSIKADVNVGERAFITHMPDQSMAPLFPHGSTLIFDPDCDACDRHYVLAYLKEHDTIVFKQLIIDSPFQYLKSLNQTSPEQDNQLIKMSAGDTIIATLVQSQTKFSL
ncbi:helix-turn-helix domain-containing protein [Piscirickettsia salmonis]|uniref:helix-turn-helix domain-containing protein n=1 Tax=Piscirickettsia salmonis TaxID=1238 RepID=UPI0007D83A3F|nr:putative HTH-type transcriptional regulator [Piscirickettsiaceae bacterium NZ-RLO1]